MEAHVGQSEGAAVLDIGGDIGAAVVYVTAALDGLEIEIRLEGRDWDGTHVAVRRRPGPDSQAVYSAVFGHLPAGRYGIRLRDGRGDHPSCVLDVEGSRVTHVHLDV